MKYNIFISYPDNQADIVQNLKSHLEGYGVKTWAYVTDRTLTADIWNEITQRIADSDLVIFVVSNDTSAATGQQRELLLANKSKILPLFMSGTDPKIVTEELSKINGDFLDVHNVKELALKIAQHQFPELFESQSAQPWRYPLPGEWLDVVGLNVNVGQYLDLGDKLYFRAISPIGLFECYAPKIQDLFWIAPENVKPSFDNENNKKLEREIPFIYQVMGMIRIDQLGWDAWRAAQVKRDES